MNPYMYLDERKERLLDILNEMLKIRTVSYDDLNKVIPFEEKVNELRELEKKYPELGIARYDKDDEGVSFLSLIATITRVLCGDSLGLRVEGFKDFDDPGVVQSFMWLSEDEYEAVQGEIVERD